MIRSVSFRITTVIAAAVLLWVGRLAWDYFDPNSITHQAMQIQLKLFGEAMYEFHANTGWWPANLNDLAKTLLPTKSYVWRETASTIVFLWPQNLQPDRRDNANVLLAYWKVGLFNRLGRAWVLLGRLADRTHARGGASLRAWQNK